jgi:hypothetical protein
MPHVCWPLQRGCPVIEITLVEPNSLYTVDRTLLADTGGGSLYAPFELVLSTVDCQQFQQRRRGVVRLSGAFPGIFPMYSLRVEVPALQWAQVVAVVGVPVTQLPSGLDGLAGFRFLSLFSYGNFGNPNQFCLETL